MSERVQRIIDYLESSELCFGVNLHSGFNSLLGWIEQDFGLQEIIKTIRDTPSYIDPLTERAKALVSDGGDERYSHPHDCALTLYVYVFASLGNAPVLFHIQRAERTFWTRRMVQHYLSKVEI